MYLYAVEIQPSMAAVCSTNSYNTLVTSKGLIWSLLDPKQPSAGIRMMAKTGPKCSLTTTRTRTLQVDFHCVPGKIATNFTINGAGDFCTTNLIVMTKEACPTGGHLILLARRKEMVGYGQQILLYLF